MEPKFGNIACLSHLEQEVGKVDQGINYTSVPRQTELKKVKGEKNVEHRRVSGSAFCALRNNAR